MSLSKEQLTPIELGFSHQCFNEKGGGFRERGRMRKGKKNKEYVNKRATFKTDSPKAHTEVLREGFYCLDAEVTTFVKNDQCNDFKCSAYYRRINQEKYEQF